ncbi:hypothetical protein MMC06_003890, partial [Schaereria dolodes]|nr:hypothetical protein [Schaereria dolodes]
MKGSAITGPVGKEAAELWPNHSIHVSTTAALKQHLGFPSPLADSIAPFKLLALGDPQLEGDTSLLDPEDGYFPSLTSIGVHLFAANSYHERLNVLSNTTKIVLWEELPKALQALRKQLDLFGNDYYLAHIYRTISWWTNPTHVTVLGDLVGSQWIEDEEFARRGWRYWQRVFRHGQKVDDEVTSQASTELLEEQSWKRRVINIAGNHDVGYAGDMSLERVERFNKVFGRANWEIKFRLPTREVADNTCTLAEDVGVPELRIVVLNSLNLDTPALSPELQTSTYNFINDVIGRSRPVEDRYTGTILLTHLPLHKESGICVDGPHFDFHTGDYGNGVKEQNHISYEAGKGILEGIFGMSGNLGAPGGGLGRHGIILTGHDHEGCDVYHHLPSDADKNARRWQAARWEDSYEIVNDSIPSIREITVRSMMGDFGGNAGLLSGWFDYDLGEWQFAYSSCAVGVQHIWWAIHILDIATAGLLLFIVSVSVLNSGSKLNADPRSKHKPPQGLSLPKGEKSGSSVSDGCCAK